MKEKSNRLCNIEVLRVFAMYMIIVSHYLYHGIRLNPSLELFNVSSFGEALNYSVLQFISVFASTGVNCFVLITGYFLSTTHRFRAKGFLNIWAETVFYTIVIGLLTSSLDFSAMGVLDMLSPIPMTRYWFVGTYMLLLLIAPLLARLCDHLSQRMHIGLLALLFLLFFDVILHDKIASGMSLGWFIFLFLLGAYLKKYDVPAFVKRHALLIALSIGLALALVHAGSNLMRYQATGEEFTLKSTANNGLTFFLSLAIFVFFSTRSFEGKVGRCLTRLAPCLFGVYLLHEYPDVRLIIWPELVHGHNVWLCLIVSAAMLVALAAVDWLRALLFKMVGLNKAIDRLTKRC